MSVDFPILSGGGSTPLVEALWLPHWGITQATMEGYATSGKIVFLVRDDMYFACTINTSTGQYRATIIGSAGSNKVVDTNDNVQFVFDYLAGDLPTAFPDITGNVNGYGTYIIVLELLTGGATITAFNVTAYGSVYVGFGHLWCIWNNAFTLIPYAFSPAAGQQSSCLERVEFLSGGISYWAFYNCRGLRSVVGYTQTWNVTASANFYNNYSLVETPNNLNGTVCERTYQGCYLLDNDVSGTYPNATNMTDTFADNYARAKPMIIVASKLTTFKSSQCFSMTELSITAPLTSFGIFCWSALQKLTLSNTNFGSLGTTTNAVDIRYLSVMSAAEITNFITALEDLTGKVAQNILKTGVTNWAAGHTTAANAKNWNVV